MRRQGLMTQVRLSGSGLRREGNGSRPGERAGEPREDGEVGVQLDALQSSDAQRRKRPAVLQVAELPLDRRAPRVELAPAQRLALNLR